MSTNDSNFVYTVLSTADKTLAIKGLNTTTYSTSSPNWPTFPTIPSVYAGTNTLYNGNGISANAYKIVEISDYAFVDKTLFAETTLSSTFLGPNLTKIGDGAFQGVKLKGELVIPQNIMSVGFKAFYNCTLITKITIGSETNSDIVAHLADLTAAINQEITDRKNADDSLNLLKAPIDTPTFTGTATIPNASITNATISSATITNASIAVATITSASISTLNVGTATFTGSASITGQWNYTVQPQLNGSVMTTEGYVNDKFSAILGGSLSSTLDTLSEIANAISNDPSFATTVTTGHISLSNAISKEVSDRVVAVASVSSGLSSAVSTLNAADTSLTGALAAEVGTRTSAVASHSSALSSAVSSIQVTDNFFSIALVNEISTRTGSVASVSSALSSAVSTLTATDTSLTASITNEVASRVAAVASLSTSVSSAVSTLTSANSVQSSALSNEIVTRISQVASISTLMTASVASLTTANATITTAITSEVSNRSSAISTAISNIIGSAPSAFDTLGEIASELQNNPSLSLTTSVLNQVVSMASAISSEVVARSNSVVSLSSALSSAVSSLVVVDTSLSSALVAEVGTRSSAVVSLSSALSSAVSSLVVVDTTLTSAIAAEVSTRSGSVVSVSTTLYNAVSSMTLVNSAQSTALATEVTTRLSAVSSISTAFFNASTAFQTADATLSTSIASLTTQVALKANKTYLDSVISQVVGNAPTNLDTLYEIAAALNNNNNFAGSITTVLASKADTAAVNSLVSTLSTKATHSELVSLSTVVGTKADTATVSTMQISVTNLTNSKDTLVGQVNSLITTGGNVNSSNVGVNGVTLTDLANRAQELYYKFGYVNGDGTINYKINRLSNPTLVTSWLEFVLDANNDITAINHKATVQFDKSQTNVQYTALGAVSTINNISLTSNFQHTFTATYTGGTTYYTQNSGNLVITALESPIRMAPTVPTLTIAPPGLDTSKYAAPTLTTPYAATTWSDATGLISQPLTIQTDSGSVLKFDTGTHSGVTIELFSGATLVSDKTFSATDASSTYLVKYAPSVVNPPGIISVSYSTNYISFTLEQSVYDDLLSNTKFTYISAGSMAIETPYQAAFTGLPSMVYWMSPSHATASATVLQSRTQSFVVTPTTTVLGQRLRFFTYARSVGSLQNQYYWDNRVQYVDISATGTVLNHVGAISARVLNSTTKIGSDPLTIANVFNDYAQYAAPTMVSGSKAVSLSGSTYTLSASFDSVSMYSLYNASNQNVTNEVGHPNAFVLRKSSADWRPLMRQQNPNRIQIGTFSSNYDGSQQTYQIWNPDSQFNTSSGNEISTQFAYYASYWLNRLKIPTDQYLSVPAYTGRNYSTNFFGSTLYYNGGDVFAGYLTFGMEGATLVCRLSGYNSGTKYTFTVQSDAVATATAENNADAGTLRISNGLPNLMVVRTADTWKDKVPLITASLANGHTWGGVNGGYDIQFYDVTYNSSNQIAVQFAYFAQYWLNRLNVPVGKAMSVPVMAAQGAVGIFSFWKITSSTYQGNLSTFSSNNYELQVQADAIAAGIAAQVKYVASVTYPSASLGQPVLKVRVPTAGALRASNYLTINGEGLAAHAAPMLSGGMTYASVSTDSRTATATYTFNANVSAVKVMKSDGSIIIASHAVVTSGTATLVIPHTTADITGSKSFYVVALGNNFGTDSAASVSQPFMVPVSTDTNVALKMLSKIQGPPTPNMYLRGVAVNRTTGNIYVVDLNNNRILAFNRTGNFMFKLGTETAGTANGQFNNPYGIAVDTFGNIYVADTANHRIQIFDSTGRFMFKFGTGTSGTANGQFSSPHGIAVDPAGNIYVADLGNHRVQVFDSVGTFLFKIGNATNTAGSADGEFNTPSGITIDPENNIIVTEITNHRIQVFNSTGTFMCKFGSVGTGTANLNGPQGVTVDTTGKILVSDTDNGRIQVLSRTGNTISYVRTISSFGTNDSQLSSNRGIAVNADNDIIVASSNNGNVKIFKNDGTFLFKIAGPVLLGDNGGVAIDILNDTIWAVDSTANAIKKFTSTGMLVSQFGTNGTGNGEFNGPTSIAVHMQTGNICVADTNNNRIQVFGSAGIHIRSFGSVGSGDGYFQVPRGIATDSAGNIYVADTGNNRIQKFNSQGEFVSKFGSLGSATGEFVSPHGIAVDINGNIIVDDRDNNRIQIFTSAGNYVRQFGSNGTGNGQFAYSAGLALNASGHIVVADSQNYRIQIIGPTPDLELDANNGVTVKFIGNSSTVLSTAPKFVYANPRGTGSEWFAVVDNSANAKTMIRNYANNLLSGAGVTYFTNGANGLVAFNNIVTTLMTDMSNLFNPDGFTPPNASGFNQPIASWDTSNVTTFLSMFEGATAFNQPIGSWDTSKVTQMSNMFYNASAFNHYIGSWNTINVYGMSTTFRGASAFNKPIGLWNTINVVNMGLMFAYATNFNQPIGSWNTINVGNMDSMFAHAAAFNKDISKWNVANLTRNPPLNFNDGGIISLANLPLWAPVLSNFTVGTKCLADSTFVLPEPTSTMQISYTSNSITTVGQSFTGLTTAAWNIANLVRISADGTTIGIVLGTSTGTVRMYKLIGNVWTQIGGDITGTANGQYAGVSRFEYYNNRSIGTGSFSMSADGTLLTTVQTGLGGFAGLLNIYKYDVNKTTAQTTNPALSTYGPINWSRVATMQLLTTNPTVVLSADGKTIAVSDDTLRMYSSVDGGTTWTQKGATITDSSYTSWFYRSISISANGLAVVAAPTRDAFDAAQFNCYEWNGVTWNASSIRAFSRGAYTNSGTISADGKVCVIQIEQFVHRYTKVSGVWTLAQTLNWGFGFGISTSADGTFISLCREGSSGTHGDVEIYRWNGSAHVPVINNRTIQNRTTDSMQFNSMLSSDGTRLVVGGKGKVDVYDLVATGKTAYTSSDTAVASVYGNLVLMKALGTSTITASQTSASGTGTIMSTLTVIPQFAAPVLSNNVFTLTATPGAYTFTATCTVEAGVSQIKIIKSGTADATLAVSGGSVAISVPYYTADLTTSFYVVAVGNATAGTSNYTSQVFFDPPPVLSNFVVGTKSLADGAFVLTEPTSTTSFAYTSNSVTRVGQAFTGIPVVTASGNYGFAAHCMISQDGKRMVYVIPSSSGTFKIFELQSGLWGQVGGDIVGTGAWSGINGFAGDESLSISADGTIVAFGATNLTSNALYANSGEVSIYKYDSSKTTAQLSNGALATYGPAGWNRIGRIFQSTEQIGIRVSLSANGKTIAFSGPNYIKVYSYGGGTTWNQMGSTISGTQYGMRSLKMSANGFSLVQLGHDASTNMTFHEWNGSNWIESIIVNGIGVGAKATISADGKTIVINNDTNSSYMRTYTRDSSTGAWSQINAFAPWLGTVKNLMLSSNGKVLISANAPFSAHQFKVQLYAWSGTQWYSINNSLSYNTYDAGYYAASASINSDGTRFTWSKLGIIDIYDLNTSSKTAYTSSAPAVASVYGNLVLMNSSGTSTITATQTNGAGSGTITSTLTVNPLRAIGTVSIAIDTLAVKSTFSGTTFNTPSNNAIDLNGNIYVADTLNYVIKKFTSAGVYVSQFGSQATRGIAISHRTGNIYVSNTGNHRIQMFNGITGAFMMDFGSNGSTDGLFNNPWGIAIDNSDYVYVSDTGNHRIQKFTSTGAYVSQFGSQGTDDGKFASPKGIQVLSNGNIIVLDTDNNRLQTFTGDGVYVSKFGSQGTGDGQFSNPIAFAIDADGNIVVADTYNNRIQIFTSAGTYVSKFGSLGTANGQFNTPMGVSIDSTGNIVVSDTNNNRVQILQGSPLPPAIERAKTVSSGTLSTLSTFGSQGSSNGNFNTPRGIAIDATGNIYVTDTNNHRVQAFTSAGGHIISFGSVGSDNGQFNYPFGIAINAIGNILVSEGLNRIQVFSSIGEYVSKFGTAGVTNGQFDLPRGIAIDATGNIYVADSNNKRIQSFTSAGGHIRSFGTSGMGTGQFNNPFGIAIASGKIVVADTANHRIHIVGTT